MPTGSDPAKRGHCGYLKSDVPDSLRGIGGQTSAVKRLYMEVFDYEIDRMNEKHSRKNISAYYRMKEHSAYKVWIGSLECLAAVFTVIAALDMTVFYVSIAYDYFHSDYGRLSAEDMVACSGKLMDITDQSYIGGFGENHFIFDFIWMMNVICYTNIIWQKRLLEKLTAFI